MVENDSRISYENNFPNILKIVPKVKELRFHTISVYCRHNFVFQEMKDHGHQPKLEINQYVEELIFELSDEHLGLNDDDITIGIKHHAHKIQRDRPTPYTG